MRSSNLHGPARVAVLGGGFAGLETAFNVAHDLGPRARITVVSDRDDFLFKPNTIYIPFGGDPDKLLIPLAKPARKREIALVEGQVHGLDPDRHVVQVDGRSLEYDYLVIATGAAMAPAEIPGLAEHAETIWTPAEMLSLRDRLGTLLEKAVAGEEQDVLFVVPPNNKCAGPLYEIVFMLETWLRRKRVRDRIRITYTTYEKTFVQAFGPKLHAVVLDEFAHRGIVGHNELGLAEVTDGEARYENGETRRFDLLIAFPPYVASMRYDGLPADERGFLTTELTSRRVEGHERIFAPGDAGDFPVKQAFLAFLQADAAAAAIAVDVKGGEPEVRFDAASMCVMEERDKAMFARVPLMLTGNPDAPVAVRPDANGSYRVGVSPAWRLGKKLLGVYLPFRFNAGKPFHAGPPWKAMDVGLKGMSAVLARR